MKYFKMVIRLGLFIAMSPMWIFLLIGCIGCETMEIFIAWLNDSRVTWKYDDTITLFVKYKWVMGD